ncbi:hypothetical protein ZWY2020_006661, partial [Hordeum vulgare]
LLNGNQLTGSLPEEIGFVPNLNRIQIDQNHISGSIPKSFANLNKTEHFHMNNNSLSGQIPPRLSRLPSLVHLLLDNNNLSDYLPPEIITVTKTAHCLDNNNYKEVQFLHLGNITTLLKFLEGPALDAHCGPGPIPSQQTSLNITLLLFMNDQLNQTELIFWSSLRSMENNNLDGSVPSDVWGNIDFSGNRSLILDFRNALTNLSNPLTPPYCQPTSVAVPGGFTNNNTLCPPCSTDLPHENILRSLIPCLCAIPLHADTLKSPGFWDFVLSTFMWEEGPRLKMNLKLFPNNTTCLQVAHRDSDIFGPYELIDFIPGWYENILPRRTKSSLSTGAIVGIVIAAFAAAAILSSLVTHIILRRRSSQVSKRRTVKKILMKIDGVEDLTFEELSNYAGMSICQLVPYVIIFQLKLKRL